METKICNQEPWVINKMFEQARQILLIKPPIEEIIPIGVAYSQKFFSFASLPSALLRLGAYLKSIGKDVSLIDCATETHERRNSIYNCKYIGQRTAGDGRTKQSVFRYGMDNNHFKEELDNVGRPDLILVSCSITYHLRPAHEIIGICKRKFPGTPVIFGGIYPTLCPEEAAKSGADLVYVGELPEANFFEADLGLLDYVPSYSIIKSTRGCPNRCSYCAVSVLEGNSMRFRDPDDTVKEIIRTKEMYGITQFIFWESNFLINSKNHFEMILDKVISNDLNLELSAPEGLSPNLLTLNLAKKMRKAGFANVNIPLESSDEKMQKRFRRTSDLNDFKMAVRNLLEAGFREDEIRVFILIGLPNQRLEGILDSLVTVWEFGCKPKMMPFTPIPGSGEFEKYKNIISGKPLEELHPLNWPFAGRDIPVSDLKNLFLYHDVTSPIRNLNRKSNLSKLDGMLADRIRVNGKIWDMHHKRNRISRRCKEVPDPTVVRAERRYLSNKNKRILDIGCRFGANCLYLQDKGHIVHGIEKSRFMVDNIVEGLDRRRFLAGDLNALDEKAAFDAIIDINNINTIPIQDLCGYIRKVSSLLTDNGYYIIRSNSEYGRLPGRHNPDGASAKSPFFTYLSEKQTRKLVSEDFKVLKCNELHHSPVVTEGRYSLVPGMYELILQKK